jgi:predicted DNA-binding protein
MSEKRGDEFIFIRVKPDMKDRLTELARADDRSVSSYVRRILEQFFEDHSLSISGSRTLQTSSRKS